MSIENKKKKKEKDEIEKHNLTFRGKICRIYLPIIIRLLFYFSLFFHYSPIVPDFQRIINFIRKRFSVTALFPVINRVLLATLELNRFCNLPRTRLNMAVAH